jgi:hypothetical protein
VLHAFTHVAPHVNAILTAVLDSMYGLVLGMVAEEHRHNVAKRCFSNPARPKVTSNAVWVLGELALKMGAAIAPYAPPFIARIGQIVNDGERNTYIRR